jgi:pilus assembly protein CpaB
MNKQRMIVLGLAVVAAGGAALLARGMMGGGTPQSAAATAPTVAMSQVLVASQPLQPGDALTPAQVRWEKWPSSSVDPSFITKSGDTDLKTVVDGMVVRAPLVVGEPLSSGKYIRGDAAGIMAATLTPGMRAVAVTVSIATVAGGFIQPNDRVDIILTEKNSQVARSRTILTDIRVLAIDQADKSPKDQKAVSDAKTATLELTPAQAELVARGNEQGKLSLSLRAITEKLPVPGRTASATGTPTPAQLRADQLRLQAPGSGGATFGDEGTGNQVNVIRYGIERGESAGQGQGN